MLGNKRVAPDVAGVAPVSTSSQSLPVGTTNWTTSVVGTTPDFLRFCHMLLHGGENYSVHLLSPRTVRYMARKHLPVGKLPNGFGQSTISKAAMAGNGFGLGFAVIEDAAALQNMAVYQMGLRITSRRRQPVRPPMTSVGSGITTNARAADTPR